MITLHFEKLYATEGRWEPCSAALPFAPGALADASAARVYDEQGKPVPTQARATALHPDGSVKWLFVRFMARVPAMRGVDYLLDPCAAQSEGFRALDAGACFADSGALRIDVSARAGELLERVAFGGRVFGPEALGAPVLRDRAGRVYGFAPGPWTLAECGEVCAVLKGEGWHTLGGKRVYRADMKLTLYRGLPCAELAYRLVDTTPDPLEIASLELASRMPCGPAPRCATGISNYKTRWQVSEDGSDVRVTADEQLLLYEGNEHNAEVFYGTFLADRAGAGAGLCATVYQAQQNYPKAVSANRDALTVSLVPEGVGRVTLQSGMAREQRVLLHFHAQDTPLDALADASTRYQMPNRPRVDPEVFARSGVLEPVFPDKPVVEVEMYLQQQADAHARAYGMLNWGDSPDPGYTEQGRGGGEPVWTNNEYDYPHACAVLYARTGIRRYLDYLLVSARHWLDVDICHYSDNPLLLHGQWEHTNGHSKNGRVECSHQWVEGLLDYYHYTGDGDALAAAIAIGENDLRLLETPAFAQPGEANARETGWALRALVALYKETNDPRWLDKCDWIVSHFEEWERRYGLWLAPYTDNTRIRVVFMIAVACASLMRYQRVRPQEKVRGMILRAVDDLLENARLSNGLFYYKELPSLQRFGNNTLILEALAIAWELTGDAAYLRAGLPTFRSALARGGPAPVGGKKSVVGDAVITAGPGTKGFAQLMLPVATYYAACVKEGLLKPKQEE